MRAVTLSPITLRAAVSLALVAAASSVAQNRNTLETKITAENGTVLLEWSKKHPWDADLLNFGALLLAEYRTANGTVATDCLNVPQQSPVVTRSYLQRGRSPVVYGGCAGLHSAPNSSRTDRTLRFRLPDVLTAVPSGPVCLYMRLQNQRVLPIRQAGEGFDTARFRYEAWEHEVVKQTRASSLRAQVEQMTRAIAAAEQSVRNQEVNNAGRGWTSAGACQDITVPSLPVAKLERPVAEPAEQDDIARQVCIVRVSDADRELEEKVEQRLKSGKTSLSRPALKLLSALIEGVVQPPPTLAAVLALLPETERGDLFAARREQIQQYDHDWQVWAPKVPDYKRRFPEPHFVSFSETLQLQTETIKAAIRIVKAIDNGKDPDPRDIRGFIGAAVEAYTRCVDDGKRQLETSYRNAMELKAKAPAIQENVRRELVQKCRDGVSTLVRLKAEVERLKQELQHDQQLLETAGSAAAVTGKTQMLNSVPCMP